MEEKKEVEEKEEITGIKAYFLFLAVCFLLLGFPLFLFGIHWQHQERAAFLYTRQFGYTILTGYSRGEGEVVYGEELEKRVKVPFDGEWHRIRAGERIWVYLKGDSRSGRLLVLERRGKPLFGNWSHWEVVMEGL